MAIPTPPTNPTNLPIQNVVPQQSFSLSQTTANRADLDNGNMFLNDGTTMLYLYNGATGGVSTTVTIWAVADEAGRTGTQSTSSSLPNTSIGYQKVVSNGSIEVFGPFRQAWWNQTSGNIGFVYLSVVLDADHTSGVFISPVNY